MGTTYLTGSLRDAAQNLLPETPYRIVPTARLVGVDFQAVAGIIVSGTAAAVTAEIDPVTLDFGTYRLEYKVNGQWVSATMTLNKAEMTLGEALEAAPIVVANLTQRAEDAAARAEDAAALADSEGNATLAQAAATNASIQRSLAQTAAAAAQTKSRTTATWAALTALTGAVAGESAEVLDTDTGTHTDPVVGGTVDNSGTYSWSVSPAGWQRVGASTDGVLWMESARNKRAAITDIYRRRDPQWARRRNDTSRLIRAEALARLRPSAATIYCDPSAVGTGDGSSWVNAFTTMTAAFNAANDGDTIQLNAPQGTPFPPQLITLASNKRALRIVTNEGSTGATWVDGRNFTTWTDAGGGIFSKALATAPNQVVYDFKQDDVIGTVTGVDLTSAKKAAMLEKYGRKADDCRAWYGFLRKAAVATATPAEGFWSHLSGVLYINPPGSPVLATVNSLAAYTTTVNAIRINGNTLFDSYIYGDLRTFCTPSGAGEGYGVMVTNGRNCTLADHTAYMPGAHTSGFVAAPVGCRIIHSTTIGHMADSFGSAFAYVFYSDDQDYDDVDAQGHDLFFVAFPALDTSGVPIPPSYGPRVGYSHTNNLTYMDGVNWTHCGQLDFNGEFRAKHGTVLTIQDGLSSVVAGNLSEFRSVDYAGTWGVTAYDCDFVGEAAWMGNNTDYYGCVLDRENFGNPASGQHLIPMSVGDRKYRFTAGEIKTGKAQFCFVSVGANDEIAILDTDLTLQDADFININNIGAKIVFGGTKVVTDIDGNCLIRAGDAQLAASDAPSFTSLGGNIYDTGMVLVRGFSDVSDPVPITDFITESDPNGRDVYGFDFGPVIVPPPVELIVNGTFDTDVASWTPYTAYIANGQLYSWNAAGYMQLTRGSGGFDGRPSQAFATVIGKTYEVSVTVPAGVQALAAGIIAPSTIRSAIPAGSTLTFRFVATVTSTVIAFWSNASNQTSGVDDVSVRVV